MAKKQTRRSVSVNRTFYDRLRKHCENVGISMSQFVETECVKQLPNELRSNGGAR